jgi:uncharacterized double-CXXCG motif protein
MKLFQVRSDDDYQHGYKAYPHHYQITGSHRWSLPGVKCDTCGWTGGAVGLAYPSVNLPEGIDPDPYENAWPVSPETLQKLIMPLRQSFPPGMPIRAGTEFGPFVGEASGRFGEVTWPGLATMFISIHAIDRLRERGIANLELVKPQITLKTAKVFDYAEIQIEPYAQLDPSCLLEGSLEACSHCGTRRFRLIDEDFGGAPVVRKDSIPPGIDLIRIENLEGYILASERFFEAARSLDLSDITFSEIQVT